MERTNLKEVKKALETMKDEDLEKLYIAHPYGTEYDEDELCLIFNGDETEWMPFFDKYKKEADVLNEFAKGVFSDAKKIIEVMEEPEKAEEYQEDFA